MNPETKQPPIKESPEKKLVKLAEDLELNIDKFMEMIAKKPEFEDDSKIIEIAQKIKNTTMEIKQSSQNLLG